MRTQRKIQKQSGAIISLVLALVSLVIMALQPTPVQAATITVSAGTDTIAEDGVCHLSEAIANVNDQAQTHADCPAGTSNDIIQLPAGTITLSADLPGVERSVTVMGAGKDKTTINGNAGNYKGFFSVTTDIDIKISQLSMTSYSSFAMGVMGANLEIESVEINGDGSLPTDLFESGRTVLSGIFFVAQGSSRLHVNNVHIHNLHVTGENTAVGGVSVHGGEVDIRNTTVSDISYKNGQVNDLFGGVSLMPALGSGTGVLNAHLENLTISRVSVEDVAQVSAALAVHAIAQGGKAQTNVTMSNVTIAGNQLAAGMVGEAAGFGVGASAIGVNDESEVNVEIKNSLLADNTYNNKSQGCMVLDINPLSDLSGQVEINVTSQGGNLTDDTSCQDHLTHATDKHNVTNLKTLLGSLGDHGGTVPTIPLLPGNPAIDGGVCEDAPSSDARGVARPQGAGCDAGAFEVQQAAMAGSGGLTNPATNKRIYLVPPIPGSVVSAAELLSASQVARDASYTYPLGLVSFTIDGVPTGSTQTIELFFEIDARAEDFELRKYNPAKHSFSAVDNATLTNETKDGTPGIKASYQLTDGGALDLDGTANGTLVDPVGLARKQSASLVNTGSVTFVSTVLAAGIMVAVMWSYGDYRRHKAPLLQEDRQLARGYTYWHHVRVVTFPLLRYRLTFIFEKRTSSQAT